MTKSVIVKKYNNTKDYFKRGEYIYGKQFKSNGIGRVYKKE